MSKNIFAQLAVDDSDDDFEAKPMTKTQKKKIYPPWGTARTWYLTWAGGARLPTTTPLRENGRCEARDTEVAGEHPGEY